MKTSKKETRREVKDFRQRVKEELKRTKSPDYDNLHPECDSVADFVEGLSRHLSKQTGEYIKKNGDDANFGLCEAVLLGIAQYICRLLEGMQDRGMVRDGLDGYTMFVEGILPSAHELVLSEKWDKDKAGYGERTNKIIEMLADENIPLEEIYDYLYDKDDSVEQLKSRMAELAEFRERILATNRFQQPTS